MSEEKVLTTYDKALVLNLDQSKYGVFAEIGAGQETANWFFRVSASAGTVAKTISAYDMTMSDAIYGKTSRYVSQDRLISMLKYEYNLLEQRLSKTRGNETTFFAFCNTVRARGYKDTGECHGWLGVRFQLKPNDTPCEIVLHLRLLDETNSDQMDALGKVGVNLIYAAFFYRDSLPKFVESLADGLNNEQVEVDMLRFSGDGFQYIDNRLCAVQLVQSGLTSAAMFDKNGEVVPAADSLYKRPILLLRGSFDPVLNLHLDMLYQTNKVFSTVMTAEQKKRAIEVCEISINNLLYDGTIDHDNFLDRADTLQALGKTVLISGSAEFYRITTYLSRYTSEPIAITLSIILLDELFKEKWSANLPGGILESFGRLFKNHVQLYVYPWQSSRGNKLITTENFEAPENWQFFYKHLIQNDRIRPIEVGDVNLLSMTSRDVKLLIESGGTEWEAWVPSEVHSIVRRTQA
jgi:hypothetical protein